MFKSKLLPTLTAAVAFLSILTLTAAVAFLSIPSTAYAATYIDTQATTIPASACRPSSDSEDAKVSLSNGAYVFNNSAPGTVTVTFYCPLPINGFSISQPEDQNAIAGYRVYFRDSDGPGNSASIKTRLTYRTSDGLHSVGTEWNSNSNKATNNTSYYINLKHDLGFSRLYAFYITMSRSNKNLDPAFSGIDFIPLPS
jgi:hypothetical protein